MYGTTWYVLRLRSPGRARNWRPHAVRCLLLRIECRCSVHIRSSHNLYLHMTCTSEQHHFLFLFAHYVRVLYLLSSPFFSFSSSSLPRRNSDTGSQIRLSSPLPSPPHCGMYLPFYLENNSALSSFADSRRIVRTYVHNARRFLRSILVKKNKESHDVYSRARNHDLSTFSYFSRLTNRPPVYQKKYEANLFFFFYHGLGFLPPRNKHRRIRFGQDGEK